MPRVTHVKSARKDNIVCKKGESYYWWKFRYGGKHYSLTYPKPSQLTQSAYYGSLYDLADMINEASITNVEDWEMLRDEAAGQMQEILDEQEEKYSNMEEYGLEYSPTGEMICERKDQCENAVNEMESYEPDGLNDWETEQDDYEAEKADWENDEPQEEDFEDDDEFEDAHSNWETEEPSEPTEDEREPLDLSEFASFVEECHV